MGSVWPRHEQRGRPLNAIVRQHLVHSHALVIGGTGMLRQASIVIAKSARTFSAVARRSESLNSLAHALGPSRKGAQYYLALDWNQPAEFLSALSRHVKQVGSPSFVLAWLHDMKLGPHVARAVTEEGARCEFFQIVGSDPASPASQTVSLRRKIEAHGHLGYHQIILGSIREVGRTRWLSNDEISAGVLEAISLGQPSHTVGTTKE